MKRFILGSLFTVLCIPTFAGVVDDPNVDVDAVPQVSPNQKGSLLWWSDVEVKWNSENTLVLDTFIELTNDSNEDVYVQLYFVNGDDPIVNEIRSGTFPFEILERDHPGWNYVDNQIYLTPNQPTYWSSASGNNGFGSFQTPPFGNLDAELPGPDFIGNGRRDPDVNGWRTVRGFVVGWAVNVAGEEIQHNNLTGSAMKVNYVDPSAWEYNAFSYKRLTDEPGDGALLMNGVEYDASPARLEFDFFAASGQGVIRGFNNTVVIDSGPGSSVAIYDTDLTIHPVNVDFRAGGTPVTTFIGTDIWNQNETRLSGTARCLSCWDQTLISTYLNAGTGQILPTNHFLFDNLGTDKGKARLRARGAEDSQAPAFCEFVDPSVPEETILIPPTRTPILGVAVKLMQFLNNGGGTRGGQDIPTQPGAPSDLGTGGTTLNLQGTDVSGILYWDIIDPGQELQDQRDRELNRIKNTRRDFHRRTGGKAKSGATRTNAITEGKAK